jgi:ATP-dependent protease ClpP protease subunit
MILLPSNLGALRAAWRAAADVDARDTPCFRVTAAADGERPKLFVFGMIGGWDNDAGEFVRAVHDIDAGEIDLHLNSPGGFVYDGVAMYEALLAHRAAVHVHIDGLAASAASFLAQAGDTIEIAKAGRMMIHDAQGVGIGGPADMREFADLLDSVSDDIAGMYAARAGGKPAAWRTAMQATTWYSAGEAVDAKLADRVSGGKDKDKGPDNRTRLIQARFRALATQGG